MTNCSLILVDLFLIGLGLGDSPLVILSLCSLVLFFVISSCLLRLFYCFLFCISLCLCPSLYSFVGLLFSWGSFNIYFLTYKKKKINFKILIWIIGIYKITNDLITLFDGIIGEWILFFLRIFYFYFGDFVLVKSKTNIEVYQCRHSQI